MSVISQHHFLLRSSKLSFMYSVTSRNGNVSFKSAINSSTCILFIKFLYNVFIKALLLLEVKCIVIGGKGQQTFEVT